MKRDGVLHHVAFMSDEEEIRVNSEGRVHIVTLAQPSRSLHEIARHEAALWSEKLVDLFEFDNEYKGLALTEIDRVSETQPPPNTGAPKPGKSFWKL